VSKLGGRTLQVEGTVADADGVTAEAHGVFVMARAETARAMGIGDA
jgi:hypothetical protein